jgi:transcriptional regulator with XRE-family HTH domain
MKAIDLHIGARLREKRFQSRLTLQGLASRVGISAHRLLRYENGEERIPAEIVMGLCNALDLRPSYLFESTPSGAESLRTQERALTRTVAGSYRHFASADNVAEDVIALREELIARQVSAVDAGGRDRDAELARIARRLLMLFQQTRALFSMNDGRSTRSPAPPG